MNTVTTNYSVPPVRSYTPVSSPYAVEYDHIESLNDTILFTKLRTEAAIMGLPHLAYIAERGQQLAVQAEFQNDTIDSHTELCNMRVRQAYENCFLICFVLFFAGAITASFFV